MPIVRELPPLPILPAHEPVWTSDQPQPRGRTIHHGSLHVLLQDVPENPDDAPAEQLDALRRKNPDLDTPPPLQEWLTIGLTRALQPTGAVLSPQETSDALRDQELTVAVLLKRGAQVTSEALVHAAQNANPRLVRRLLAAERDPGFDGDLTRCPSPASPTPLMDLATNNHWSTVPEIVDHLLDAGIPLNLADSTQGRNALHWAVVNNNLPATHALLERGADPDLPDRRGHTALHLAALKNYPEVLHLLIDAGGDPARRATPVPLDQTPPDMGVYVPMLGRPQREEPSRDPATCEDTPLLQAAAGGASMTLALLMDMGLEPFPPVNPNDPYGARDTRALDLARDMQQFQERGTSSYAKKQCLLTVERLERHLEQHVLRQALGPSVDAEQEPVRRPRL